MDTLLFISFLTATLFIVLTPGPSVALASSQAVRFGPQAAAVTVAGDALGSVVHIVIAVVGLKTFIQMSEVILPFLQIAGGCFILYFAWQSLRSTPSVEAAASQGAIPPRATFLAGFFACVTNPKAIVFFLALFPGFISPDHSIAIQSLVYGLIFVMLDAAFIFGYAMIALYTFRKTISGRFSIEKISGLGLLGVGVVLILKGYKELPSN